jgi:hypothetical protein
LIIDVRAPHINVAASFNQLLGDGRIPILRRDEELSGVLIHQNDFDVSAHFVFFFFPPFANRSRRSQRAHQALRVYMEKKHHLFFTNAGGYSRSAPTTWCQVFVYGRRGSQCLYFERFLPPSISRCTTQFRDAQHSIL